MSRPTLRPEFYWSLTEPARAAIDRLEAALDASEPPLVTQRTGLHMTVTVPPRVRHLWSPWLNLEFISPTPDGGGSLHARFSPAPSLWTGFMMLYLTLATAGFFALMFVGAQLALGHAPTLLWVVLGCTLGGAGLWWVSRIGQNLARQQMVMLRDAVESALDSVKTPPPPC